MDANSKTLFFSFILSAKIKNIISTEDAKAKLLAEQRNKKKDNGTSFVPTNIAVNYVQHNRCKCTHILPFLQKLGVSKIVMFLKSRMFTTYCKTVL